MLLAGKLGFIIFLNTATPTFIQFNVELEMVTNEHFRYLLGTRTRELDPQSTYVCRVQSSVWRLPNIDPPPPFHQASVPPALKAGGYTLAGRGGGWGVNNQYFGRRPT
jgi:hypothetical protein